MPGLRRDAAAVELRRASWSVTMNVRRVGVYLLTYLLWLGAIFAVLFVLHGRLFPKLNFGPPALFLVATSLATGITVAQALRKRR